VDVDPARVAFATTEYPELTFAACRPDGLDLEDESVDVVFSTVVLHFVPEVDAYLSECRRVLRREGHLVIMLQNPESFWMRLRGALGRNVDGPGWGGRSRADFTALLQRHGFVVEREEGFFDPPFDRLRTPGDAVIGVLNGIGHQLDLRGCWSYVGLRCRVAP
jgi:SAM-dependent methyltransferase